MRLITKNRLISAAGDEHRLVKHRLYLTERATTLRTDLLAQAICRPILLKQLKTLAVFKDRAQHIFPLAWRQQRVVQAPLDQFDRPMALEIDFFDHLAEPRIDAVLDGPIQMFGCQIQLQNRTGKPADIVRGFDFAHTQLWYSQEAGICGEKAAWMAAAHRLLIPVRPIEQMDTYRWVRFLKRGYRIPANVATIVSNQLDTFAKESGVSKEEMVVTHV
jgi:hypothetical protein